MSNDRISSQTYLLVPLFVTGFGETPRFLPNTGDRFGEYPFSFSGDGVDPPPVAEFRRDADKRTVVSRWRNLCVLFAIEWLIHFTLIILKEWPFMYFNVMGKQYS